MIMTERSSKRLCERASHINAILAPLPPGIILLANRLKVRPSTKSHRRLFNFMSKKNWRKPVRFSLEMNDFYLSTPGTNGRKEHTWNLTSDTGTVGLRLYGVRFYIKAAFDLR